MDTDKKFPNLRARSEREAVAIDEEATPIQHPSVTKQEIPIYSPVYESRASLPQNTTFDPAGCDSPAFHGNTANCSYSNQFLCQSMQALLAAPCPTQQGVRRILSSRYRKYGTMCIRTSFTPQPSREPFQMHLLQFCPSPAVRVWFGCL